MRTATSTPLVRSPRLLEAALDEKDCGFRRDGVRPLNVERDFERPIRVCRGALRARGVDFVEAAVRRCARGQAELRAEDAEIGFGVGIVVRVDDADDLAGALVRDLVEAVSMANLSWAEASGSARRYLGMDLVRRAHEGDGLGTFRLERQAKSKRTLGEERASCAEHENDDFNDGCGTYECGGAELLELLLHDETPSGSRGADAS